MRLARRAAPGSIVREHRTFGKRYLAVNAFTMLPAVPVLVRSSYHAHEQIEACDTGR